MIKNNQDYYNLLKKIHNNPSNPQRKLAKDLGFSLGKLNYCLQALKEKGFVKINNFRKKKTRLSYLYLLTPKGVAEKSKLTISFMKNKMKEYDELKREFEREQNKQNEI